MCYEVMRDSVENLVRKWKDEMSGIATVTQDGTMVTVTMPHGDVIFINLVCLPDVDPRGAKGSERR